MSGFKLIGDPGGERHQWLKRYFTEGKDKMHKMQNAVPQDDASLPEDFIYLDEDDEVEDDEEDDEELDEDDVIDDDDDDDDDDDFDDEE